MALMELMALMTLMGFMELMAPMGVNGVNGVNGVTVVVMNRARARYNPSQGKQVTRILTSAEIRSDFPGPKTGSAGTMSIRVTPYKPCGARPRAATATFLLCIMCLQNGTAGLAAKGTYPASARTLATPRACRLGLGKQECWQAAHHSCTTHATLFLFPA